MKQNKILLPLFFLCLLSSALFAKEYNILDCGAIADTSILSTQAIQKAIDRCTSNGGGQVIVPAGHFKTGTIILKNNVDLYLENDAILYGSRNLEDYLKLKPAYISLRTQEATIQLIYAENVQNVSISGFGEINGQGSGFKKLSMNDEGITRPHLLRFITCNNVTIENITLTNSGCWMQHYLACKKVQIRGVWVFNRNNFNNDALDIDGGTMEGISISGIQIDGTESPVFIRLGIDGFMYNSIIDFLIQGFFFSELKPKEENKYESKIVFKNGVNLYCAFYLEPKTEIHFVNSIRPD